MKHYELVAFSYLSNELTSVCSEVSLYYLTLKCRKTRNNKNISAKFFRFDEMILFLQQISIIMKKNSVDTVEYSIIITEYYQNELW